MCLTIVSIELEFRRIIVPIIRRMPRNWIKFNFSSNIKVLIIVAVTGSAVQIIDAFTLSVFLRAILYKNTE